MRLKIKSVHDQKCFKDFLNYGVAFLCLLAAIPAGLILITIPLIFICLGLAIYEYRLPNSPRQFALFLSPILAPALVVLFSPTLSSHAAVFQFFKADHIVPFAFAVAGCAWLLIMPLLVVENQWRSVLLTVFWLPITFILGIIGTLDMTGWP